MENTFYRYNDLIYKFTQERTYDSYYTVLVNPETMEINESVVKIIFDSDIESGTVEIVKPYIVTIKESYTKDVKVWATNKEEAQEEALGMDIVMQPEDYLSDSTSITDTRLN